MGSSLWNRVMWCLVFCGSCILFNVRWRKFGFFCRSVFLRFIRFLIEKFLVGLDWFLELISDFVVRRNGGFDVYFGLGLEV